MTVSFAGPGTGIANCKSDGLPVSFLRPSLMLDCAIKRELMLVDLPSRLSTKIYPYV